MDTLDHDFQVHLKQFAGDEKLYKTFYKGYVPDEQRSLEEGRPIYRDVVMIRIITPGNRDNIVDREANEFDKHRFRQAWQAFQAGDETQDGTPLAEWLALPRSMVEELRYFHIYSVEKLAEANEAVMAKMPGLREWSERAKAWLQAASDSAALAKAQKEKEESEARIKALEAQVAELAKLARPPEGGTDVTTVKNDSTGDIAKNQAGAAAAAKKS